MNFEYPEVSLARSKINSETDNRTGLRCSSIAIAMAIAILLFSVVCDHSLSLSLSQYLVWTGPKEKSDGASVGRTYHWRRPAHSYSSWQAWDPRWLIAFAFAALESTMQFPWTHIVGTH